MLLSLFLLFALFLLYLFYFYGNHFLRSRHYQTSQTTPHPWFQICFHFQAAANLFNKHNTLRTGAYAISTVIISNVHRLCISSNSHFLQHFSPNNPISLVVPFISTFPQSFSLSLFPSSPLQYPLPLSVI